MEWLSRFNAARVLVVGDLMLDRFVYGAVDRVSPEAPVPIVSIDREVEQPGGAGNVARCAASLGAQVVLVGVVGGGARAAVLRRTLETEAAFLVVGQLGWQDLERDVALQLGVEGLPHHAHPALADLLDQAVMEQCLSGFDRQFGVLLIRTAGRSLHLQRTVPIRTPKSFSNLRPDGPRIARYSRAPPR